QRTGRRIARAGCDAHSAARGRNRNPFLVIDMRVFTPGEVAANAANKYLGVLVAAKHARTLNEFPRDRSSSREKKLTTRSLEELAGGDIDYHVVPRRRSE